MGREIRRVPKEWQHPKDESGHYLALYDEDYESALEQYQRCPTDWDSIPPDPDYFRQAWDDDNPATHYQVYQDVSEGTPVSPVFASLDEMVAWLIGEGYSEHAANKFAQLGWAPSMMFSPDKGLSGIGIHSLDWINEESDQ